MEAKDRCWHGARGGPAGWIARGAAWAAFGHQPNIRAGPRLPASWRCAGSEQLLPTACRSIAHPLLSRAPMPQAGPRWPSNQGDTMNDESDQTLPTGFSEHLNRYRATGKALDLEIALTTIAAAMRRGRTEEAAVMARAVRAVTGLAVMLNDPAGWQAQDLH